MARRGCGRGPADGGGAIVARWTPAADAAGGGGRCAAEGVTAKFSGVGLGSGRVDVCLVDAGLDAVGVVCADAVLYVFPALARVHCERECRHRTTSRHVLDAARAAAMARTFRGECGVLVGL